MIDGEAAILQSSRQVLGETLVVFDEQEAHPLLPYINWQALDELTVPSMWLRTDVLRVASRPLVARSELDCPNR
jgi:hypothetical protein